MTDHPTFYIENHKKNDWIWLCFTLEDDLIARCKICNFHYCVNLQSANFIYHLNKKHMDKIKKGKKINK